MANTLAIAALRGARHLVTGPGGRSVIDGVLPRLSRGLPSHRSAHVLRVGNPTHTRAYSHIRVCRAPLAETIEDDLRGLSLLDPVIPPGSSSSTEIITKLTDNQTMHPDVLTTCPESKHPVVNKVMQWIQQSVQDKATLGDATKDDLEFAQMCAQIVFDDIEQTVEDEERMSDPQKVKRDTYLIQKRGAPIRRVKTMHPTKTQSDKFVSTRQRGCSITQVLCKLERWRLGESYTRCDLQYMLSVIHRESSHAAVSAANEELSLDFVEAEAKRVITSSFGKMVGKHKVSAPRKDHTERGIYVKQLQMTWWEAAKLSRITGVPIDLLTKQELWDGDGDKKYPQIDTLMRRKKASQIGFCEMVLGMAQDAGDTLSHFVPNTQERRASDSESESREKGAVERAFDAVCDLERSSRNYIRDLKRGRFFDEPVAERMRQDFSEQVASILPDLEEGALKDDMRQLEILVNGAPTSLGTSVRRQEGSVYQSLVEEMGGAVGSLDPEGIWENVKDKPLSKECVDEIIHVAWTRRSPGSHVVISHTQTSEHFLAAMEFDAFVPLGVKHPSVQAAWEKFAKTQSLDPNYLAEGPFYSMAYAPLAEDGESIRTHVDNVEIALASSEKVNKHAQEAGVLIICSCSDGGSKLGPVVIRQHAANQSRFRKKTIPNFGLLTDWWGYFGIGRPDSLRNGMKAVPDNETEQGAAMVYGAVPGRLRMEAALATPICDDPAELLSSEDRVKLLAAEAELLEGHLMHEFGPVFQVDGPDGRERVNAALLGLRYHHAAMDAGKTGYSAWLANRQLARDMGGEKPLKGVPKRQSAGKAMVEIRRIAGVTLKMSIGNAGPVTGAFAQALPSESKATLQRISQHPLMLDPFLMNPCMGMGIVFDPVLFQEYSLGMQSDPITFKEQQRLATMGLDINRVYKHEELDDLARDVCAITLHNHRYVLPNLAEIFWGPGQVPSDTLAALDYCRTEDTPDYTEITLQLLGDIWGRAESRSTRVFARDQHRQITKMKPRVEQRRHLLRDAMQAELQLRNLIQEVGAPVGKRYEDAFSLYRAALRRLAAGVRTWGNMNIAMMRGDSMHLLMDAASVGILDPKDQMAELARIDGEIWANCPSDLRSNSG